MVIAIGVIDVKDWLESCYDYLLFNPHCIAWRRRQAHSVCEYYRRQMAALGRNITRGLPRMSRHQQARKVLQVNNVTFIVDRYPYIAFANTCLIDKLTSPQPKAEAEKESSFWERERRGQVV